MRGKEGNGLKWFLSLHLLLAADFLITASSFDVAVRSGIKFRRHDKVRCFGIHDCRRSRSKLCGRLFSMPNAKVPPTPERPTPAMPSSLFQDLAQSQFELLAAALVTQEPRHPSSSTTSTTSKVKSIALYLPQENSISGQLEFIPAVLYPPPSRDRVFIASGAESGRAPTIPRTLTTLPGFSQARSLLPGYPMVQSGDVAGVGAVEEVFCAVDGTGAGALSVPLFAGSQTTGVLLVYPSVKPLKGQTSVWAAADRDQVARAAKTLSLALSMDAERAASEQRQQLFAEALSDSLHQVKNPLQALRTYGKLLQQRIADVDGDIGGGRGTRQLLELTDHLMVQGDRLTARLQPMDAMIDEYAESSRQLALMPAMGLNATSTSISRWTTPLLPYQNDTKTTSAMVAADELNAAAVGRTTGKGGSSSPSLSSPPSSAFVQSSSSFTSSLSILGDFECGMTFVSDVLASTFESFRAIAQDQNVKFIIEEAADLPGVQANADALQEAVSNVIDNAIKYVKLSKPGSRKTANPRPRVRVRLFANKVPDDSGVTILVEDNGPGISAEGQESIFLRGYRDPSTQQLDGSGIGLHIARELIRKMGGTLQIVKPDENTTDALNGARFQFQLYRKPKQ
eukprot:scaffold1147_cov172-Amphora_coffeaeformis.AAC.12